MYSPCPVQCLWIWGMVGGCGDNFICIRPAPRVPPHAPMSRPSQSRSGHARERMWPGRSRPCTLYLSCKSDGREWTFNDPRDITEEIIPISLCNKVKWLGAKNYLWACRQQKWAQALSGQLCLDAALGKHGVTCDECRMTVRWRSHRHPKQLPAMTPSSILLTLLSVTLLLPLSGFCKKGRGRINKFSAGLFARLQFVYKWDLTFPRVVRRTPKLSHRFLKEMKFLNSKM